ncbi:MAG: hypothetical protein R3F20_06650 [Planctomycetota bacterium]
MRTISALVALLLLVSLAHAQDEAPVEAESRLPVKVIGGKLVARCEIASRFRRLPVNLFVDYTKPCGLEIHNQAAKALRIDDEADVPLTIRLPGFDLEVARREHGDEDELREFTRLYSKELGETACVGTIGAGVLADYHLTFDLPSGFVVLRPKRERTGTLPDAGAGSSLVAVTVTNGLVWFPVVLEDGRRMAMNLGSSRFDTIVDDRLCRERGHPAGDLGAVKIGEYEISRWLAFRPEELAQVHPDGAFGTSGINLLECFRIEIDRENRWARFTPRTEPKFPEADLAFFRARVTEEIEPLETFLKEHGKTRLAREASELLLDLHLDEESPAEAFETALAWYDRTRIEDLRATEALTAMKKLVEASRPDVAIRAGRIGIESGRKDRYPESVHKLHARVGELCLESGEEEKAWEHLLSAAFGLPSDGRVNLNLGRFYEKQGRMQRAMSRYVQAVIQPESGQEAVAGLERVQRALGAEALSVDLVDRLISGKVYGFTSATKFEPTEETNTNRVVLAEHFTNPHFGRELPEGWDSFAVGGTMAVEGLLSHYPRDRVVVITHHIPVPEPCATINAVSTRHAESYRIDKPQVIVSDGRRGGPGAERARNAEKVFEANRDIIQGELARKSAYTITLEGKVAEGVVSGRITVEGPENDDAVVQVLLVERGVLYPGKAQVVVHRNLVRGSLTGDVEGEFWEPEDGEMSFEFSRALADVTAENRRFLEAREAAGNPSATRLSLDIDPRQAAIVAFVRDTATNEILQAAWFDPNAAAEGEDKR